MSVNVFVMVVNLLYVFLVMRVNFKKFRSSSIIVYVVARCVFCSVVCMRLFIVFVFVFIVFIFSFDSDLGVGFELLFIFCLFLSNFFVNFLIFFFIFAFRFFVVCVSFASVVSFAFSLFVIILIFSDV